MPPHRILAFRGIFKEIPTVRKFCAEAVTTLLPSLLLSPTSPDELLLPSIIGCEPPPVVSILLVLLVLWLFLLLLLLFPPGGRSNVLKRVAGTGSFRNWRRPDGDHPALHRREDILNLSTVRWWLFVEVWWKFAWDIFNTILRVVKKPKFKILFCKSV